MARGPRAALALAVAQHLAKNRLSFVSLLWRLFALATQRKEKTTWAMENNGNCS